MTLRQAQDRPYTERTGGSYLRDPKTGQRTQVVKPPERPSASSAPAPEPADARPATPPAEPAAADTGKPQKKDK